MCVHTHCYITVEFLWKCIKKLIVGVESNVGSKSVLASIQKQPHTETTLQHH